MKRTFVSKLPLIIFLLTCLILLLAAVRSIIGQTLAKKYDYSSVSVYAQESPSFQIRPVRPDNTEEETVYFFLPYGSWRYHWNIPSDITLKIDDRIISQGDVLELSDADTEHRMTLEKNGVCTDVRTLRYMYSDSVASLSINFEEKRFEKIKEDYFQKERGSATMLALDRYGRTDCFVSCEIGGHGNSTWEKDKKPFEIETLTPLSVLGLKECRKWNLIANGMDYSNVKDMIVYEAAKRSGMEYYVDCEYVNLYVNGSYQGLYIITERPSANGGIVKFDDNIRYENLQLNPLLKYNPTVKDAGTAEEMCYYRIYNSPPDISGSYLMEFDRYEDYMAGYVLDSYFRTSESFDPSDLPWMVLVKHPKIATEDEVAYLRDYVKETERAIYSDDGVDPYTGTDFRERIDFPSWAMSYLFMDFFGYRDYSAGSMYFYKKRNDPLLYSGPIWDYDKSMTYIPSGEEGLLPTERADLYLWYERMDRFEDFHDTVMQNYTEHLEPAMDHILKTDLPEWTETIDRSAKMDEVRWTRENGVERSEAEETAEWLRQRKELFDLVWIEGGDSPYAENIY